MSSRLPADSGRAEPPPPRRPAFRIGRRSAFWLSVLFLVSAADFTASASTPRS
jgi:hypothetical protein